jgi:hypothetical protein
MKRWSKFLTAAALAATLCGPVSSWADDWRSQGGNDRNHHWSEDRSHDKGGYVAGDFHQHTYYTDGSTAFDFVMSKDNEFGLDWWANSEHGGARPTDGEGDSWLDTNKYPKNPILGDNPAAGNMYRWQSLRDFVYPDILEAREMYPEKRIISGLEWNVPGHEHCSVGVVSEIMGPLAISAFEFQFDKSDKDTSRVGEWTPFGTLAKKNGRLADQSGNKPTGVERHADAVAASKWMQDQYDAGTIDNAWIIFAHIERAGVFKTGSSDGGYNIEHFRDFNNAAPDICFGFEGAPGHQVNSPDRGGFGTGAVGGGTYGGTGIYTAQVGGLWDALLGEGRRWFNFASSDYHKHWTNCDGGCGDDYFPGEYQKTWTYVVDKNRDGLYSLNEIADGLRSGNSFHVMGDLIDALEFTAESRSKRVPMGGELYIKERRWSKESLVLTIKFKSPAVNNFGETPVVNHIDLIGGQIMGKVDPSSPDYTKATNDTTRLIASFTAADWRTHHDG